MYVDLRIAPYISHMGSKVRNHPVGVATRRKLFLLERNLLKDEKPFHRVPTRRELFLFRGHLVIGEKPSLGY